MKWLKQFWQRFLPMFREGIDKFLLDNLQRALKVAKDLYTQGAFTSTHEFAQQLWLRLRGEFPEAPGTWLTMLGALVCDALKKQNFFRFVLALGLLIGAASTGHAQQQFLGGGITTNAADSRTRTGPYVEGQALIGSNKLGALSAYGLFLPEPAARLGIDFAPFKLKYEHVQGFVGAGHEWTRRPGGRVDANPTLAAGFICQERFRVRATGLFGDADGFRLSTDYLHPLKRLGVSAHVAVEGAWQERRPAGARFLAGIVKTWKH